VGKSQNSGVVVSCSGYSSCAVLVNCCLVSIDEAALDLSVGDWEIWFPPRGEIPDHDSLPFCRDETNSQYGLIASKRLVITWELRVQKTWYSLPFFARDRRAWTRVSEGDENQFTTFSFWVPEVGHRKFESTNLLELEIPHCPLR
jgi:hypothetical protein